MVELIYSWFRSWIPWDPNETISHAYTSTILNITISDYSLPIILELFHKVIFKIFRAVFPWSGQLMRPCCMVDIPLKVTCKYTRLLSETLFQQILSMLIRTWILCFVRDIMLISSVTWVIFLFDLSFCRWSYGILLYEIFTKCKIEWKFNFWGSVDVFCHIPCLMKQCIVFS